MKQTDFDETLHDCEVPMQAAAMKCANFCVNQSNVNHSKDVHADSAIPRTAPMQSATQLSSAIALA